MARALVVLASLALAPGHWARAQPQAQGSGAAAGASGWQLGAGAGVLRADEDLARGVGAGWLATAGARAAYRVAPEVALGAALWGGRLEAVDPAPAESLAASAATDGELLWGAGLHLLLTPLATRDWPADPILDFGLEAIRVDDGEDRSVAFVFGAGIRRRWASRWSVEALVRNRFLSVEEEPVEEVATGRDANLWEIAVGLDFSVGGNGR